MYSQGMSLYQTSIGEIFQGRRGDFFLKIPSFQRKYSWDRVHWATLFSDVLELVEELKTGNKELPQHFMSMIILQYQTKENSNSAIIVDGQQRLTTLSLFIKALLDSMRETSETSNVRLKLEDVLFNKDRDNSLRKPKLVLLDTDKQIYEDIMEGSIPHNSHTKTNTLMQAYEFFKKEIRKILPKEASEAADVWNSIGEIILGNLDFVVIRVTTDARKIFESVNGLTKKLTLSQLIKNYILIGENESFSDEMYKDYLKELDNPVWEDTKGKGLDDFFYFWLLFNEKTTSTDEYVMYAHFKELFADLVPPKKIPKN